jgi:hypothetical protein
MLQRKQWWVCAIWKCSSAQFLSATAAYPLVTTVTRTPNGAAVEPREASVITTRIHAARNHQHVILSLPRPTATIVLVFGIKAKRPRGAKVFHRIGENNFAPREAAHGKLTIMLPSRVVRRGPAACPDHRSGLASSPTARHLRAVTCLLSHCISHLLGSRVFNACHV